MSFAYKQRVRDYVDVSEATENDRIKVTFEDGSVITLMKPVTEGFRQLAVDRERSSKELLESLYLDALEGAREGYYGGPLGFYYTWRRRRKLPSLDVVRETAILEVSVRDDGDAFDNSPRVGEKLCIMPLVPHQGGSGWYSPTPVAEVEFYTL